MGENGKPVIITITLMLGFIILMNSTILASIPYTVASGNSLYRISQKFGTNITEIRRLNDKWDDGLYVGQVLMIPSKPQPGEIYYVEPNDSLYIISQQSGISITELRKVNNIWNDNLFVGQKLTVPSTPSDPQNHTYQVQNGDTLYKIAQKFGVSLDALRTANGIYNDMLYVGQIITIPETGSDSDPSNYTVRKGDSLYLIAQRFGTSITALKSANNLTTDSIWVGQMLIIPKGEGNPSMLTIVVDPGHGGTATGAVAKLGAAVVKESELTLDLAERLSSLLQENGHKAILTRTSDSNLALWRRVQIANDHAADVFVSIHVDSNPDYPKTSGSNVYVSGNADAGTHQLANTIQRNLEQTTKRPTNALGRVLTENFAVVMQSRPAMLIEVGFLSNSNDLQKLTTGEFRSKVALGICRGIEEWTSK